MRKVVPTVDLRVSLEFHILFRYEKQQDDRHKLRHNDEALAIVICVPFLFVYSYVMPNSKIVAPIVAPNPATTTRPSLSMYIPS